MGASPVVFDYAFGTRTVVDAADEILQGSDAAICDHRLRRAGYAQFDGAELVAQLVERGFPAVLLTVFADQDGDSSIRRWRHKVPVVLDRDAAGETAFRQAIEDCRREIAGQAKPTRRPRRTFVRVLNLRSENDLRVVDALVPSWNAQKAVTFPLELVPEAFRGQIGENALLTAMVNLGAAQASELFFEGFEVPPDPDSEDGLA
jgi:hypothetical protein